MFQERTFEDIICKYPDLLEEDLKFIGRQITLYGRRMDILFEDKFKRKLIIELKAGPIKDEHIGQILSYEGMLLSSDDPTLRVMLVGNRVPPNIQRSLDHHGIAWKEISLTYLKEFLLGKKDELFLNRLDYQEPELIKRITKIDKDSQVHSDQISPKSAFTNVVDLVAKLKSSENYKSFKGILSLKNNNEERAKSILKENLGKLNHEHLREIITLIDEPYPYSNMGKISKSPWFGRLLKPNALSLFNEDTDKINIWFNILSDNNIPLEKKLELLLNEPYIVKGLNVGFITLMLYLLDKVNYLIWFESQHDGLRIIYPNLEKFDGSSSQYNTFNNLAKKLANQYGFEHSELDWVFTTGLYLTPSLTIYDLPGLDESKYSISEVFNKQKASDTAKRILLILHEKLINLMNQKHLNWSARTHSYGISYLCNDKKAFLWINVGKHFVSMKFFTGNSRIEGLEKAIWVNKGDNLGSEMFRIADEASIDRAVNYAMKAYEIALNWTE